MNLWALSATDLAAGYAAGTFTPRDALESILTRIEAVNPKVNAIVTMDIAAARAAADASTTRWHDKAPLGAFDGVPLTVKDNIPVRGMRATWGSRIYADWVPEKDELPVARLRARGAVILGKTNCPEFTLQGYCDNPVFGVTRNPWNLAVTPGGSSGGAVAAVAAGLCPVAVGTDGGGSIRRPAAHCGLVGHKPSRDAVARADGFPVILLDCEVIGPIARSVADARALFHALAGTATPVAPTTRTLRIRYVQQFGGSPVDPEIARNVAAAAKDLEALGHVVEQGDAPFDVDALNRAWPVVSQVGLAWLLKDHADRLDEISAPMRDMVRAGNAVAATDYYAAVATIFALRERLAAFFEGCDLILTPSIAALSWPAAEAFPSVIDGQSVGRAGTRCSRPSPTWPDARRSAFPASPPRAACRSAFNL